MDVVSVQVMSKHTQVSVDPRFIAACEFKSLRVLGTPSDQPVRVGATVVDDEVHLITEGAQFPVTVTLLLAGIRKGSADVRFKEFPESVAERNNARWASFLT